MQKYNFCSWGANSIDLIWNQHSADELSQRSLRIKFTSVPVSNVGACRNSTRCWSEGPWPTQSTEAGLLPEPSLPVVMVQAMYHQGKKTCWPWEAQYRGLPQSPQNLALEMHTAMLMALCAFPLLCCILGAVVFNIHTQPPPPQKKIRF